MKQIRVKMTKDHEHREDANTTRKYPQGLVFGLPEDTAHEFVQEGAASYVNEEDAPAKPSKAAKKSDKADGDDDIDHMKKDELEALAAERGVDLGDAKTKAEIIDVIRKAAEAK